MGDRQPYLGGAESARLDRMPPERLAEKLAAFDVVSFDVFDTAVFRPFSSPTDLFMVLGEQLDFTDFHRVRVNAERLARSLRKQAEGDTEVNLEEIYACVERETGMPCAVGAEAEIAAEENFSFANPYMQRVHALLKAKGKTIIFTSDMYLGEAAIRRILSACGYDGGERIFVSSEYRYTKRSGKLFAAVKHAMGEDLRYVHVGDHAVSDVECAARQGFDAVHYENINQAGNPWRAPGMTELVGSIYRGLVNAHLYHGLRRHSVPYEHGFIYGGLYVLGFAQWIREYCRAHGITKVLFLSRDGAIYRQVFRLLDGHQDSAYVYWSRLPTICLEAERNRHNFLQRGIRERLDDVRPMTAADTLRMLRLPFLVEKLAHYAIAPDDVVSQGNVGALEQLAQDSWDDVLAAYAQQERAARQYLEAIVKGHARVAVVDTGWYGSGPLSIQWLVERKWRLGVTVDCLLAGSNAMPMVTLPRIMHGKIHAYLFDWSHNRDHAEFHAQANPQCNNAFFELFTQAPQPSFEAFSEVDGQIGLQFGLACVENYRTIRQIHRGILDFARHYLNAVCPAPYLLSICGRDAYLPFRFIASFPEYFQKFFGHYKLRNTLGECGSENLETLGALMIRRNVGTAGMACTAEMGAMPEEPPAQGEEAADDQGRAEEATGREELLMELCAVRGILASTEKRLESCLLRQAAREKAMG